MAECIRYECDHCGRAIEAWSDGNPYYIDQRGRKRYAYHPDHEGLSRCVGNDEPHLCLACGGEFVNDNRSPVASCPSCDSADISPTFDLKGRPCPFCGEGRFGIDPEFYCIS